MGTCPGRTVRAEEEGRPNSRDVAAKTSELRPVSATGPERDNELQRSVSQTPILLIRDCRPCADSWPLYLGPSATGDQWRNNYRKNEVMEPKQKQHPVLDGTADRSKV